MSGPAGYVSAHGATSFAVTVTALRDGGTGQLFLDTRPRGSADNWTTRAQDASPAVGDVLTASGLTQDVSLEWRLIEGAEAEPYDGTHGITTPAASPWSSLTATVSTALQGQGMDADGIYIGRQPEANYPDVTAIIRSDGERVTRRANNVERVEYAVEVELRVTITDDDGDEQKVAVELWQERLRTALHEKHAVDFPGIAGLEDVLVEIESKDLRGGAADEYEDEVRARATVTFAIWRAK